MVDLSKHRAPILEKWPLRANYVLFIDESGVRDLINIDRNWPILSLFGVLISDPNFRLMKSQLKRLKDELWPPEGKYTYHKKRESLNRAVCLHSREMRQKVGPFSPSHLSDKDRHYMDRVLWDDIFASTPWEGFSAIIDKRLLTTTYLRPSDPYELAVTFILERLALNEPGPSAVLFEARGAEEDTALWHHVRALLQNGTKYVDAARFRKTICEVGWHPKFTDIGEVVCGHELADLCCYAFGAHYIRNSNQYAQKVTHKLHGYAGTLESCLGKGYKVFPSR